MHLTQALHRSRSHTPDAPATIFGDRVRTAAEQHDRVARLAGALRTLDVATDDRVAILALNSDRYLELLLAVAWADGIFNPVNTRWSTDEIAYSLCDSGSTILVVDETFAPMVPDLVRRGPDLRAVIYAGDGAAPDDTLAFEDLVESARPIADARRGGDAVAGILYTGGTTGHPKGVTLSHANLMTSVLGAQATWQLARLSGRMLHAAPLFHMAGLHSWLQQLTVGGTQVIVPRFDPVAVMAAAQRSRATTVLLVPTMIQALIDHPEFDAYDLTSLTTILYGAAPISETLLGRAMAALPHAEFVELYGMTEVGTITVLSGDDHRRADRPGSAGRATAHAEVRIVDADGNDLPRGTVGEVVVRGGNVMSGYWNKPEETAAVVRDGWLRTGDGASMDDDGYVYIVDRVKDMIITGGENVYSVEVEQALSRHPGVANCAVIGVHDDEWGERVHAVVVPVPGAVVTPDDLRDHVRSLIAGYKVPRTVELVDALPLSGAGKVLKRELRARSEARA